jgi:hypothetical protein
MMLLDFPFLSQSVCYLSELAIIGNPIYPNFNIYDVKEECKNPFSCYDNAGLKMFVGSSMFKPIVGGYGDWDECDDIVRVILSIFS